MPGQSAVEGSLILVTRDPSVVVSAHLMATSSVGRISGLANGVRKGVLKRRDNEREQACSCHG
jgi:hypothetical protein